MDAFGGKLTFDFRFLEGIDPFIKCVFDFKVKATDFNPDISY